MKSIRQKRKEVGRKSLFSRFVYLYRLTVVNEDEQRRVFRMKISHFILTVIFLAVAGLGAWGGIAVFRRLPKRGFNSADHKVFQLVNLSVLEENFNAGETVDVASLRAKSLLSKKEMPLKVLADGEITKALTVKAVKFSAAARAKIEAAGGSCIEE